MIVLDTHVWFWWQTEHPRLPPSLESAIEGAFRTGTSVGVSVISCWELGMLIDKNRLHLDEPLSDWIRGALGDAGIETLGLSPATALAAASLPGNIHGDPADRIIVATARVHEARLLTVDRKLLSYKHVRTEATE